MDDKILLILLLIVIILFLPYGKIIGSIGLLAVLLMEYFNDTEELESPKKEPKAAQKKKEAETTQLTQLPPSAKALNIKMPEACSFNNADQFDLREQYEDRTMDYRLAKRQKMAQQNMYRNQYTQARSNVDRFRFIWDPELKEQERRQWWNSPAGATRASRYDTI